MFNNVVLQKRRLQNTTATRPRLLSTPTALDAVRYLFSHCSKKARRQFYLANTKNLKLWIDLKLKYYTFSNHTRFKVVNIFSTYPDQRNHRYFIIKEGVTGVFYVDWRGTDQFEIVLDNKITCDDYVFEMLELFNPTVEAFEADGRKDFNVRKIMEFMMTRQSEPLLMVAIDHTQSNTEHRDWCYENIDATLFLELGFQEPGSEFEPKLSEKTQDLRDPRVATKFNPSARWLNILDGSWLTMENVMKFRHCRILEMNYTNFTQQDTDQMLTMWVNGEFPNLTYLKVGWSVDGYTKCTRCPNQFLHYTKDQLGRRIGREEKHVIKFGFRDFMFFESGGVDIFRNDGKMGTLQWKSDFIEHYMELLVWKS
ncbi:unnamed protein product [Caenorhabditis brenneri]